MLLATLVKLSDRMLEPVPVPLGGWGTRPRLRPIVKLAPSARVIPPPTLSKFRSRPMLMPVPAPLRLIPLSTSSVFTSPPVVIEAPGKIEEKARRLIAAVPLTTRGPDSYGILESLDRALPPSTPGC